MWRIILRRPLGKGFGKHLLGVPLSGEYLAWEVQRVYAVILTGGKQYRVQQGDVIYVEKLNAEDGAEVSFDVLLLAGDDAAVSVGNPVVTGAKVTGKVVRQVKSAKVIVYKYKAKKNERKKKGHRQPYTKVEITSIVG